MNNQPTIVQNILHEVIEAYPFQTFIQVQEFFVNELSIRTTSIEDFDILCEHMCLSYLEILHIHPYNLTSLLQDRFPYLELDRFLANIIHIQANLHRLLRIHPKVDYFGILQILDPVFYEQRVALTQNHNNNSDSDSDQETDTFSESDFESIS
jgi:hypothetical protein